MLQQQFPVTPLLLAEASRIVPVKGISNKNEDERI